MQHDPRSGAYTALAPDGTILGGAAPDWEGRWTWWSRSTQGRRVWVADEAEAVAALRRNCEEVRESCA